MVGSAIIRRLLAEGYSNIISSFHSRKPLNLNLDLNLCNFVQLDLEIQKDVNEFFEKERPEYVFLAAARVGGIYANSTFPADFINNNLMIQTCVLHSAYLFGVKKLLFLGSSCIYPRLAPQPMKEEYLLSGPLEPTNEPYAVAKIAGIKMCQAYNKQYGTNFISVIPTNLYGPNDNYDLMDSHVLSALIRKFHLAKLLSESKFDEILKDFEIHGNTPDCLVHSAYSLGDSTCLPPSAYSLVINHLSKFGIKLISGADASNLKPLTSDIVVEVWGTGSPRREFMYSDDLADACVFLMDCYNGNEIINIGTGTDVTVKELAEIIKEVSGFDGEIVWDSSRPGGIPRKLLDSSKLRSLGWEAKVSLQKGIESTYKCYCA